jgi:hypothetical protein
MKIILVLILIIGLYIFLNCYMNMNKNFDKNFDKNSNKIRENFAVSPNKYLDNEINDKLNDAILKINEINVIKPLDKQYIYDLTKKEIDEKNVLFDENYKKRDEGQNTKIETLKNQVNELINENTFVLPNNEIKINSIRSLQNSQPLNVEHLENGNYLIKVNKQCLETNGLARTRLKPCNVDNPNQYFSLDTMFNVDDYQNNLNNKGETYKIDKSQFKYPFNIVKSLASGNCLTNNNSILTITPCNPNISQHWAGSTDPILCSYEQV